MSLCGGPPHPQPAVPASAISVRGAGAVSHGSKGRGACVCVHSGVSACALHRVAWFPAVSPLCLADARRRHRQAARERLGRQVPLPSPLLLSRPSEMLAGCVVLAVAGAVVEVVGLMPGRLL